MTIETKTILSPATSNTKGSKDRFSFQWRRKHSHSSDDAKDRRRHSRAERNDDNSSNASSSHSHSSSVDDNNIIMMNGGGTTTDDDDYNQAQRARHRHALHDDTDDENFDYAPPFLPLEEQNQKQQRGPRRSSSLVFLTNNPLIEKLHKSMPSITMKQFVSFAMGSIIFIVIWDALFRSPEDRLLQPESSLILLRWVQDHPLQGLIWITLVIAACVVVMIPLGTPLTLGCGYVYKGAYGWRIGVTIATIVSMGGSCLGAVLCFLLGRYLMRDTVKKWVRKYPIFDAIDIAAAEHGLRIMAMLYLTPILPLGPVSYMCGTTSMPLSSFVLAKIAALPLMLLYVFIGASMGALVGGGGGGVDAHQAAEEVKQIEENEYLIASGILLSFVMIACITRQVKKELNKILERQQKLKPGETEPLTPMTSNDDSGLEMGITKRRRA